MQTLSRDLRLGGANLGLSTSCSTERTRPRSCRQTNQLLVIGGAAIQTSEIALANLQHEYIVWYYHRGRAGDATKDGAAPTRTLHILMEYCDGGGLDEFLVEQRTHSTSLSSSLKACVRSVGGCCSWSRRRVHSRTTHHPSRPQDGEGAPTGAVRETAKLGDFGISREMSTQTNFAKTAVGTPYYLSPELITSAGYDGRADVWSIGIIIYELITFHRPFHGENIAQLAMAVTRKQPKELPAEAPQDLVELTKRCLKKEKTTRPTSAELPTRSRCSRGRDCSRRHLRTPRWTRRPPAPLLPKAEQWRVLRQSPPPHRSLSLRWSS